MVEVKMIAYRFVKAMREGFFPFLASETIRLSQKIGAVKKFMNVAICSLIASYCGLAQNFTVKGTLSASAGLVRYASIVFVDVATLQKNSLH